MSEALHRALAAYQQGELHAAADALDEVLDADPRNADALMLAGLVANRRGTAEVAVTLFDRAVAADPEHDGAWCNRASPLARLGRLHEAERSLRRALELRQTPQAAAMLLRVLLAASRPEQALLEGRRFLQDAPDHPLFNLLIGQAHLQAGHPREALQPLQLALRAGRPEAGLLLARALRAAGMIPVALRLLDQLGDTSAEAHNLRGLLHLDGGDVDAAIQGFRASIASDPHNGPAHHNLASSLQQAGQPAAAVPHHLQAIALDPDDHERWVGLVDSLRELPSLPTEVVPHVTRALEREGLAHQGLERLVRQHLAKDPEIAAWLDGGPATSEMLARLDCPLVHGWLWQTRVLGPRWERALTRLRRAALLKDRLHAHPELLHALAAQAWHTEHAWIRTHEELSALPAARPLLRLLYEPVPDEVKDALPDPLARLVLELPAQERALADEVVSLTPATDATSQAVQAQYEDNPYPRLISVHRKPPIPLPALVRKLLPHVQGIPDPRPLRVLIAGCGTGQQILGAQRYAHAQIHAIDLSRASLGVAARQISAWGLSDQVRLAQADLLELDEAALRLAGWPVRYEVIECGGVLHHLADPMAGWRRLLHLLAPGGLMKIGLYSERARSGVIAASERVQDLPLDPEGLRQSRGRLLDLPSDHAAHSVVHSVDFPSLSGFRDLVRHACEHRFTPLGLAAALDELGLEFLGFQHLDPRPARWYEALDGDADPGQRDLARWERVEQAHPDAFVGMYQFWCRRRD